MGGSGPAGEEDLPDAVVLHGALPLSRMKYGCLRFCPRTGFHS